MISLADGIYGCTDLLPQSKQVFFRPRQRALIPIIKETIFVFGSNGFIISTAFFISRPLQDPLIKRVLSWRVYRHFRISKKKKKPLYWNVIRNKMLAISSRLFMSRCTCRIPYTKANGKRDEKNQRTTKIINCATYLFFMISINTIRSNVKVFN